jgi:hypothetical protein
MYGFTRLADNEYACYVDEVIVDVKESIQEAVKFLMEKQIENNGWKSVEEVKDNG